MTPPQHLFYFTQASLKSVLEQTGYEQLKIIYSGRLATLECLGFRMQEAFGPAMNPIRMLTKLPMIRNRRLSINLHDIVTLLAVKKP